MRKLALPSGPSLEMLAAVAGGHALSLRGWWEEVNESPAWQDGAFFSLSAAYALVSAVALIQLIRIQLRVPEFGWTTQKVFHLMNFFVNGVRAIVFGFHVHVFLLQTKVYTSVLLDLPGLLFFSTYTLLVLFWAEIYHQAKNLPTDKLRVTYILVNSVIYVIQVCIWLYLGINDNPHVELVSKVFISAVSFIALLGFLIYGGRLFSMLRRFPIESTGRRKKLYEVGTVTGICFTCFLIRCIVKVPRSPGRRVTVVVHQGQAVACCPGSPLAAQWHFRPLILIYPLRFWIIQFWTTFTICSQKYCRQPLYYSSCGNFLPSEYQRNTTLFIRIS